MDGFWWNSGIFFCVICTAIGIVGNGLTIGIFARFKKFRNFFGFYILRYLSQIKIYFLLSNILGFSYP
jgi:hypothetical protein